MSFAGTVQTMINTIKNNRNLVGKRSNLFDSKTDNSVCIKSRYTPLRELNKSEKKRISKLINKELFWERVLDRLALFIIASVVLALLSFVLFL